MNFDILVLDDENIIVGHMDALTREKKDVMDKVLSMTSFLLSFVWSSEQVNYHFFIG